MWEDLSGGGGGGGGAAVVVLNGIKELDFPLPLHIWPSQLQTPRLTPR